MNKMKWIIFALAVVAIFGGIVLIGKNNDKPFTGNATRVITQGPIADHVFGTDAQKVTLIEYGDYECPGCGAMYPSVKDFTNAYKDKLTFVFRNFPLTTVHPNALASASAAEAAGLQGKFWEMHDTLYSNQNAWAQADATQREAIFEGYANNLGLNVNKFKQDLSSKDIQDKINRDRSSANQFTIDQTPTFILDGKKIDASVATNPDSLRASVEAALKSAYPDFTPVPASSSNQSQ